MAGLICELPLQFLIKGHCDGTEELRTIKVFSHSPFWTNAVVESGFRPAETGRPNLQFVTGVSRATIHAQVQDSSRRPYGNQSGLRR